MSDDLNITDASPAVNDALTAEPAVENTSTFESLLPSAEIAPESAATTVSRQEYEQLANKLQAAEKWKQDAMRFFNGNPIEGNQNPLAQLSDQQLAQLMLQNPKEYGAMVANQAVQMVEQQAKNQALLQEYRGKYPDMLPFEGYILNDAANLAQDAMRRGEPISDQQAVDAAISAFKSKIGNAKQQAQGQALQREALKLDVRGSQPLPKLDAETIWSMPQEAFDELDRQLKRQLYKY